MMALAWTVRECEVLQKIPVLTIKGIVDLYESQKGLPTKRFQVGVKVEEHPNHKFWRTKLVTFTPRFILVNNMKETIHCKQKDTKEYCKLDPGQQIPFHWTDDSKPTNLCMMFSSHGWSM